MATKAIFSKAIDRRSLITIIRYINVQDIRNYNWGISYLYPGADLKDLFDLSEDAEIVEGEYLYIYFDEADGASILHATWEGIPAIAGVCDLLEPCSVLLVRIL